MNLKEWLANSPTEEELFALKNEGLRQQASAAAQVQFADLVIAMKRGLGSEPNVTPPGTADAPQPPSPKGPKKKCWGDPDIWDPTAEKCIECPRLEECAKEVAPKLGV